MTRNRWWHWLLGTYLIITIWFVGSPILLAVTTTVIGEGSAWQQLAAELSTFIPFVIATPLVWRYWLQRDVRTLISNRGVIDRQRIALGFGMWFIISLASSAIDFMINRSSYRWTFDLTSFIPFLVIALTLLPLQTSAEEFFFRGWIVQWASKLPIAATVIISGAVFALPHLGNPEAAGHELAALAAWFVLGAGWAYTAVRDGSIELALGAHFANNVFSILVVGYDGAVLPTSAIVTTSDLNIEATAVSLVIAMALFIAATRPRK